MPTPPAPSTPVPTASGRAVVTGFVAIALLFGAGALWLRYDQRDRILGAQLKAMPTLSAQVTVRCLPAAGEAFELHRGDRCPAGAGLSLTMTAPGFGTEAVLYTLLAGPAARSGALARDTAATVALGAEPGPRTLLLLLASTPVTPAELQAAVERAADVPGREAAVNAMVAALIRGEKHARAERFDFEVSAAP